MMRYIENLIKMLSLALLLASSAVYAESKDIGLKILKESYKFQDSLDRYAYAARVVLNIADEGEGYEFSRVARVKIERPGKLRIDNITKQMDRSVYFSDGVFTMIDNDEKYYAQKKAAKSINWALDQIREKYHVVFPTAMLIYSDMRDFFQPKKVYYFGKKTVDRVSCDYVAFRYEGNEIHLWIEDSKTPLIRKMYIKDGKGTEVKVAVRWDLKPNFKDEVFNFEVPAGASKISMKETE